MAAPPVQHLGVQVHAHRDIARPPAHPLAGGVGGPAEVFPEALGVVAPQALELGVDEVDFVLDALHRLLVEGVTVGLLGHGLWTGARRAP